MGDYMESDEVLDLIRYVDDINLKHGAPKETTDPNAKEVYEFEKLGISHGLKLLRSKVRHLGTEINLKVLANIYEEMKPHIDYSFEKAVKESAPISKILSVIHLILVNKSRLEYLP